MLKIYYGVYFVTLILVHLNFKKSVVKNIVAMNSITEHYFAFHMNGSTLHLFIVVIHCRFNIRRNDRQKTDALNLSMVTKHLHK